MSHSKHTFRRGKIKTMVYFSFIFGPTEENKGSDRESRVCMYAYFCESVRSHLVTIDPAKYDWQAWLIACLGCVRFWWAPRMKDDGVGGDKERKWGTGSRGRRARSSSKLLIDRVGSIKKKSCTGSSICFFVTLQHAIVELSCSEQRRRKTGRANARGANFKKQPVSLTTRSAALINDKNCSWLPERRKDIKKKEIEFEKGCQEERLECGRGRRVSNDWCSG